MIKSRIRHYLYLLLLVPFVWSCEASKQLAYFQDLDDSLNVQNVHQYPYKPLVLQPDDQVQITISSTSPESSQFFNLQAATVSQMSSGGGAPSSSVINVYTISSKGDITMPVFGDIHVAGFTTEELKEHVSKLLLPYLKDGIVSVRLVNFRVTVIGEVGHPFVVPITGERFNVIEAIGAAGDMTVFAKRYNVRVMRRTPQGLSVAHLNFNNSKVFQSPYFQLQQNDLIYVEPHKSKATRSENAVILIPIMASILTVLINLATRFR